MPAAATSICSDLLCFVVGHYIEKCRTAAGYCSTWYLLRCGGRLLMATYFVSNVVPYACHVGELRRACSEGRWHSIQNNIINRLQQSTGTCSTIGLQTASLLQPYMCSASVGRAAPKPILETFLICPMDMLCTCCRGTAGALPPPTVSAAPEAARRCLSPLSCPNPCCLKLKRCKVPLRKHGGVAGPYRPAQQW